MRWATILMGLMFGLEELLRSYDIMEDDFMALAEGEIKNSIYRLEGLRHLSVRRKKGS